MTTPKYPTGVRSTYDNGDRLREAHLAAYPNQRPFLERNGVRLIVLCIVGLIAIGAASWGLSVVNDIALDRIEMGVE